MVSLGNCSPEFSTNVGSNADAYSDADPNANHCSDPKSDCDSDPSTHNDSNTHTPEIHEL